MIRLSKSVVGALEAEAVAHVIEDIGYLGMGDIVGAFEKELEQYICCLLYTSDAADEL